MKHNRFGITFKTFRISFILLIASATFIYLAVCFIMPKLYYREKVASAEKEVEALISNAAKTPKSEAKNLFSAYRLRSDMMLMITNKDGSVFYSPVPVEIITDIPPAIAENANPSQPLSIIAPNTSSDTVYLITRPIYFAGDPAQHTLNAAVMLQPISEATQALFRLLPWMILIIIVISVTGAFLYSKLITKPLIALDRSAKKLAKLDFSEKNRMSRNDEIGDISDSLYALASGLEKTLRELQGTNLKLIEENKREREIERNRSEFTTAISHELKTPTTVIRGQLEGMIENVGSYKDHDKYLAKSLAVVDEMDEMVRELLDLAKLDSHDFRLVMENVGIATITKNTIEKLQPLIQENNIDVQTRLTCEGTVVCDLSLIPKAISNVLKNAVEHSPAGANLTVLLASSNGVLQFSVENSGTHIPEEELPKLFSPFYRIEKSRSRSMGGSGLGLYIVKTILDAHGFPFGLENTDGGVRFWIHFKK